jgi:hypothetical protein
MSDLSVHIYGCLIVLLYWLDSAPNFPTERNYHKSQSNIDFRFIWSSVDILSAFWKTGFKVLTRNMKYKSSLRYASFVWNNFSFLSLLWINEKRLMRLPCSLFVSPNTWKPEEWNQERLPLLVNRSINVFPRQQIHTQQYASSWTRYFVRGPLRIEYSTRSEKKRSH